METDAFARLEERINKAVAHIEELTRKNRLLTDENNRLALKIETLEDELKVKELALNKMEDQTSKVSDKVKDKIERLLAKIDNYDKDL